MRPQIRSLNHAALLAAATTLFTASASAQGALVTRGTVLATTGDTVNGLGGETFASGAGSNSPAVDANGQVVFWAQMVGGAVTNGANDDGYFRGTTKANTSLILRGGDPCPGLPGIFLSNAALTLSFSNTHRLSSDGRIALGTNLSDPVNPLATTVDSAILGGVVGNIGVYAREGDPAPGTVGALLSSPLGGFSQTGTGLNSSGRIFFQSGTSGGDTTTANNIGWFTGQAGSLELVIRKGDAPPGAPGTAISAFGTSSQMNDAGQIAYNLQLSTTLGATPATAANNAMVMLYTPGAGNLKIVREGDPAPGTVGATFNNTANSWGSDFGTNAFNASGQVGGWWALLNGDAVVAVNDFGLYRASPSGATLIIRRGDAVPGTGGATLIAVVNSNVSLNNNGKFLAMMSLNTGSGVPAVTSANDNGLWTGDEFGLTKVIREGDPAPGMAGGEIVSNLVPPFLLNDLNQVLFSVDFTGGVATKGLYTWDPIQGVTLQLTDLDTMEVQPGVFKASTSWTAVGGNSGNSAPFALNHSGKFALRFTHALTGSSIVSGEVINPTPTTSFCFGDGTGTACPCGNSGAFGHGCASSTFTSGAILSASGFASVTPSHDTLQLTASNIPGPGLFFQGDGSFGGGLGIGFGDGLLCSGGTILRLGVVFPTGSSAVYPGGVTPNPIHVGGATAAGDVRNYQCWYRDAAPFCTASTYNLTQSLSLTWSP